MRWREGWIVRELVELEGGELGFEHPVIPGTMLRAASWWPKIRPLEAAAPEPVEAASDG